MKEPFFTQLIRGCIMNRLLVLGDKGYEVKKLQSLLNQKLKIGPKLFEDGHFGKRTRAAVTFFQATFNMGVDGIVGPKTWAGLTNTAQTMPKSKNNPIIVAGAPWMKIAKKEYGQKEIVGTKHNNRIIAYHKTTTLRATNDETAWCSSFVNWCLAQTGIEGTNSAAAVSRLRWGKHSAPKNGAITVIYNKKSANSSLSLSGNHTAFFVRQTKTHYILLGGNQSNQVKASYYPKSS
jgi:uncharacterized protein (TIGR02594 family)